jgi:hypothetical protein
MCLDYDICGTCGGLQEPPCPSMISLMYFQCVKEGVHFHLWNLIPVCNQGFITKKDGYSLKTITIDANIVVFVTTILATVSWAQLSCCMIDGDTRPFLQNQRTSQGSMFTAKACD